MGGYHPFFATGFRFNAKATGEMSIASLKQQIQLKELKHYNGGDAGDDDDDDGDGNSGGGGTSGNGGSSNSGGSGSQNGTQQQNPPAGGGTTEKYTVTYEHEGSTYTTQEYSVGAAVTAPAPPTGYIWLNVPSVMPARNVTCESYEDDPNNI